MATGAPVRRLFLIDDESDMTSLLGGLFKRHGFQIEASNDPSEALRRLLEEKVDAVIMDLMMPGLDGMTLISKLRASPLHAETLIWALSARVLDDADRKILWSQRVRFVPKPVSPIKFLRMIRDALGG